MAPRGTRANPDLHSARRTELLDDLLIAEAEELAHGRRHLTVVHGQPDDAAEAEALNEFYDTIQTIADSAEWSRLTGGRDYLTVTVAGRDLNELLAAVAELFRRAEPDRWHVFATPRKLELRI